MSVFYRHFSIHFNSQFNDNFSSSWKATLSQMKESIVHNLKLQVFQWLKATFPKLMVHASFGLWLPKSGM